MRLSHKRNKQLKQTKSLNLSADKAESKAVKPKSAKALAKEAAKGSAPKEKKVVAKKESAKKAPAKKAAPKKESVKKEAAPKSEAANLTPKQQSILDIVVKSKEALSTKEIGVQAGQEEAKASAWATSGLKKLVEENLVNKVTDGSKVTYTKA